MTSKNIPLFTDTIMICPVKRGHELAPEAEADVFVGMDWDQAQGGSFSSPFDDSLTRKGMKKILRDDFGYTKVRVVTASVLIIPVIKDSRWSMPCRERAADAFEIHAWADALWCGFEFREEWPTFGVAYSNAQKFLRGGR